MFSLFKLSKLSFSSPTGFARRVVNVERHELRLLVHVMLPFNGDKPNSMNVNQTKFDSHIKLMSHEVSSALLEAQHCRES